MTEHEWLTDPCHERLYGVVRDHATTRQLRLYMAACCRLKVGDFFDPQFLATVEAAERCADDPAAEELLTVLWSRWTTSSSWPVTFSPTDPEAEFGHALLGAWQLLDEVWADPEEGASIGTARHVRLALTHAVFMCVRDRPQEVFPGHIGDAVHYCTRAITFVGLPDTAIFADRLRDIFGNPFRSITFDPEWRSDTAVSLARVMYTSRDFEPMPILADALMDAGCDHPDILAHCRDPHLIHTRGCWAVDLVLGKS